jgi:geranylgeranyl diphosphate synthase type 3
VAHKIFGVPATINCANYVYFLALAELSKIPNPKMLTIFTGTLPFVVNCLCLLL